MKASAPPGARASQSVMPSPTMTTLWKECACLMCATASALPPLREGNSAGSNPS